MARLLDLKAKHFVLWNPGGSRTPELVIGNLRPGNPSTLANQRIIKLEQHPDYPELWLVSAANNME